MIRHTIGVALVLALALSMGAAAQGYSVLVPDVDLDPACTDGSFGQGELAVNPTTGTIYVIDDSGDNDLIRVVPGAPNTVTLLASMEAMAAAIDAADGTTVNTFFEVTAMDVADDGDVILVGFCDGSDSLVSVTDGGVITVVYTDNSGVGNALDGSAGLTVIGNNAYVATDDSFGNSDSIQAIDTNDVGAPFATATELVSQATLEGLPGQTALESGPNALSNDGVNIIAILSEAAASSDDIVQITTAGVATILVNATDIVADLAAQGSGVTTDVGYGGVTVDAEGDVWLLNPFGAPSSVEYDGSVLQVTSIVAPNGDAQGYQVAQLDADIGSSGPFLANDSLQFDASNNRVLFVEGDTDSIIAGPDASGTVPVELSVFAID